MQGTGLGLCFSWNLVHHMGGTLKYASEYTDGARFEIWLPLKNCCLTHTVDPKAPAPWLVVKCGRILLVDNDESLLKTLTIWFQKMCSGWVVDTMRNGDDMDIAQVLEHDYDVILVDYYMGPSGGIQTGDEVVRNLVQSGCRALIVGYSGNDKQQESTKAGAAVFLRKPLPSTLLLNEHLPLLQVTRVHSVVVPHITAPL